MPKEIKMPKEEFVKEHKKLIKVLSSKDKEDDKEELDEQKDELVKVLKKNGKQKLTSRMNALIKGEAEEEKKEDTED